MKWLLLLLLLSGCAETRIYERGQLIAEIQGDAQVLIIKTDHTYFYVSGLDHSKATAAAYTGATAVVGSVGTAVVSGLVAKP